MVRAVLLALFLAAPGQERAETPVSEAAGLEALREERYPDALRIFDALAEADPESARVHYGRGLALAGLFDYGGAAQAFERAVALDPELAAAYRQLAIVESQLGERESAREAYQRALALAPVPAAEAVALARALRKAGLLDEAKRVLEGAGLSSPAARFELGVLEMAEGNFEAAAEHLERGAQALGTAPALYQYARSLERLGRMEEAIATYERVLEQSPSHRRARFRLGTLLLRTGGRTRGERLLRDYEAFRQWDREVKLLMAMVSSGSLGPEEWKRTALRAIDLLLEGGALAEAGPIIDSGLARYPDEPRFRIARARWLFASGRVEEARGAIAPLLAGDEPPLEAQWLDARLRLRAGQSKQALELYRTVSERWSNPPAAFYQEMATAFAMRSHLEEARKFFEKALAIDPSLAAARADLGLVLETLERFEEAETQYRRALELDPDLVSAQQGLASLLLRRGDADEAVRLFGRSVELHPDDPVLRTNFAIALERAGRLEEARAERERAKELAASRENPPS